MRAHSWRLVRRRGQEEKTDDAVERRGLTIYGPVAVGACRSPFWWHPRGPRSYTLRRLRFDCMRTGYDSSPVYQSDETSLLGASMLDERRSTK